MTPSLYETIRRIVQQELRQIRTAELGVVQEQHPHAAEDDTDNYGCTVRLRNSGLVLRQVPVATQRIGQASIPAEGELVLVQFVGGDVNAPVITGRLYNDEDRPPVNADGQAILHVPPGAGEDEALHVELHSGEALAIHLTLGAALTLDVQDDDPVVTLDIDGGKATLQIDRDGAITVESQGAITLKGNEVTVEADTTLTLKGGSEVTVEGGTINLN